MFHYACGTWVKYDDIEAEFEQLRTDLDAEREQSDFRLAGLVEIIDVLEDLGNQPDECENTKLPVDYIKHLGAEIERLKRDLAAERERCAEIMEILSSTELLEALSGLEHERWSGWHKYCRGKWTPENIERWNRLADVSYDVLPDQGPGSKESDRVEARKTIKVILDVIQAQPEEPKENKDA